MKIMKLVGNQYIAEEIEDVEMPARPQPSVEQVREWKLQAITQHDCSDAVNSFTVNGVPFWLNKADRVGLMNSTTILKEANEPTTTLWMNGVKLVLPCDLVLQILAAIEIYALECYGVTETHKSAVNALTSVEEIEAYDHTSGYPTKPSFITGT